jgi:hypothetical protein
MWNTVLSLVEENFVCFTFGGKVVLRNTLQNPDGLVILKTVDFFGSELIT